MKYILASASPRRKELLAQAGFTFDVCPSGAEERIEGESPAKIVEGLAALKARDIIDKSLGSMREDFTVIGADTVVAYQGEILGKPTDQEEALAMLSMLANRTHQVYSGVCPIQMKGEKKYTRTFHVCTQVTFYPVSREELLSYIRTGDPMDKAGSYGIQGPFAVHIKEIQGDYNNVVGLPIAKLYHELREMEEI